MALIELLEVPTLPARLIVPLKLTVPAPSVDPWIVPVTGPVPIVKVPVLIREMVVALKVLLLVTVVKVAPFSTEIVAREVAEEAPPILLLAATDPPEITKVPTPIALELIVPDTEDPLFNVNVAPFAITTLPVMVLFVAKDNAPEDPPPIVVVTALMLS